MQRLKCTLQYDGSGFSGFQIQPGKRTVQGILENALLKMHKGEPVRIHPSGRTDTGVHAKGQTIHFDSPYSISLYNWKQALNTLLPHDVYVKQVETVPDTFHARYDVVEKEYRYYVYHKEEPDVFKRNYSYFFPYALDLTAMQAACRYLEGTHDFTTFSSAKATTRGSKQRTLYQVSCEKSRSEIEFIFRGSGFLYNMVRIIVGVLLDIGQGRRKPADIDVLLSKRDRRAVGETVPSQGLYLWRVTY
ncbi:tRNA pseudouridine synthase A 1 [Virgibacillus pantothenticus]|uniref:tRNA pseudouridine synthase A n=1 Tax=Virgibacillus pantothenticus TaxID=1473 RepID=A0A0L0QVR0_VIRPA|nr:MULTISPECIES: tRNA pseudouridine(38-40) synthase TruA [Virgibacillus]API92402.1 tRNA pseudouridine(38-40) synthase TruA [Virgibacillus sp. 6R]KNE22651.1 tRNA pseudouridine synthase A [Virgibacillus pantothenticus]MBS7427358.1 tRNA pseudouridine(38-40) synthase TruA [Virgibacillus sp. 19R1-5]MBU8566988.1 tRNA pseudouridine(38-40) synthase TruA [Virgibacillus pantothenticus]MBU8602564.1 tRNA pseudouridine(38-40) synthase TruA [Virgibacillus pantothenticus]